MVSLIVLALFGYGLSALLSDSDNTGESLDVDLVTEHEDDPDVPDDGSGMGLFQMALSDSVSQEPLDTGVSVFEDETGTVIVDVGEDETGSLVLFNYEDTEDAGNGLLEIFEQRLYLVPEGVVLPQGEAGASNDNFRDDLSLDELEELYGLELLGSWDLGTITPTDEEPFFEDNRIAPPVIQANAPISNYDVLAITDGDEIFEIRPEGFVPPPPTYQGVPQQEVTADTTGTDATDWLTAQADSVVLNGAAGDDLLEGTANNVTLIGGEGADELRNMGQGGSAQGGPGDDVLQVADGEALGGPGNDLLSTFGPATSVLRGEAGDDGITAFGAGTTVYGGEGEDFLGLNDGATGYGGAGDDLMQLDPGTRGYGGDGDDLFNIWNQFTESDTPVATGGAGSDTFDMQVWNAYGETDAIYSRITDFDPDEDILQVGSFQTTGNAVDFVSIEEASDGSYTDVLVHYTNTQGLEPGIAVIRLDGVTDFDPNLVRILG